MARSLKKRKKHRSEGQKQSLVAARAAYAIQLQFRQSLGVKLLQMKGVYMENYERRNLDLFKWKAKQAMDQYQNERKRTQRMEKAASKRKEKLRQVKKENGALRIELERLRKEKDYTVMEAEDV
ncbi:hypothetical protein H0H92_010583, partial [Tricholoma furcatifolium]